MRSGTDDRPIRFGRRENLPQFALLAVANALVGPAKRGLAMLLRRGGRLHRRGGDGNGHWVDRIAIRLAALYPGVWGVGQLITGCVSDRVGRQPLIADIGDVAHPSWRARSAGVYRLWRDGGFAVGALTAGVVTDAFDVTAVIWSVAALIAISGVVVMARMHETRQLP